MERRKFKKPRKKMSAEQRAAAAERLAKARAKKAPAKNKSVHPSVLALPDDHYLSYVKVKQWIKTLQVIKEMQTETLKVLLLKNMHVEDI